MFFFIVGVQPKTRILDNSPRRCSQCGLHQAHIRRVDHYISLFFIPLIRIRKGEPFLFCQRCQSAFNIAESPSASPPSFDHSGICSQCGRRLEADFNYCPECGQRQ